MSITKIDRPSYLIIDNSVLSMLTEWHCTDNMRMPVTQLLAPTQEWLLEVITMLRSNTVDNAVHTTNLVSAEYKPEKGYLGSHGVPANQIASMANVVNGQFNLLLVADTNPIQALRSLPDANKRLVHPRDGLSDPDLSLVYLGLQLTQHGHPVIILSNDQDLLDFVTWVRTQKSLRANGVNPLLLESETGLGYLELLHRGCIISSEKMRKLISYFINDTMERMQTRPDGTQLGLQKAMRIIQKATAINSLFAQAVEMKAENRRTTA